VEITTLISAGSFLINLFRLLREMGSGSKRD